MHFGAIYTQNTVSDDHMFNDIEIIPFPQKYRPNITSTSERSQTGTIWLID